MKTTTKIIAATLTVVSLAAVSVVSAHPGGGYGMGYGQGMGPGAGMMGQDHTEALATMTLPTLIVWGDRDALFDADAEAALCSAIPHARFVTYEGVGHGVQWEVPLRVAGDVGAFALAFSGR